MTAITSKMDKEIRKLQPCDLEGEYWHFTWRDDYLPSWNIYEFHEALKLYSSFCRRWEELHHGSLCVVERVRDRYLMPKIREFAKKLKEEL